MRTKTKDTTESDEALDRLMGNARTLPAKLLPLLLDQFHQLSMASHPEPPMETQALQSFTSLLFLADGEDGFKPRGLGFAVDDPAADRGESGESEKSSELHLGKTKPGVRV